MDKQATGGQERKYTIQSIDKALDVIELLSEYESLSLLELAKQLKQPKSSLYRIVLTLEQRGYIARSDKTGKYCLGYKQLIVAKQLLGNNSLRSQARQEMERLSTKYGDTVNLGVLNGKQVLYLDIIEGTYSLRMNETIGSTAPPHATAIGKVILADRIDEAESWLRDQPLVQITPNTITDPKSFIQELERIRTRGYALDDEESVVGARCIAAAIRNYHGKAEGAISLSGAIHRYPDDQLAAVAADVMKAAFIISRKRGYES